ncbi:MAG: PQQ-binding-like beta-propeller repeat protein [Candidatus Hydrogenedentes bacterium]|nr:PQQ-binding-like beta-propeller repeat protein [Candidatus Hydrogenedentota bacterium]
MHITARPFLAVLLASCAVSFSLSALDITWTRSSGQFPPESTPVLIQESDATRILVVNRGGQLMRWNLDGSNAGPGQDGTVIQLPEGEWFSAPLVVESEGVPRVLLCSGKGLVVALDAAYQMLWQYQLPGETGYGAAVPLEFPAHVDTAPSFCIADKSGTVTSLNADGSVRWQKALGLGECKTIMSTFKSGEEASLLLVGAGSTLLALNKAGETVWSRDLGQTICAGPVAHGEGNDTLIVCGAGTGSLHAFNGFGEPLWKAPVGDEMDSTIVFCDTPGGALVLCKGLWGNLHAFNQEGTHLWTHLYRAKSRGKPLVLINYATGAQVILITTYGQQALLFNLDGILLDMRRLAGAANGALLLLPHAEGHDAQVLTVTASLLAHCLELGPVTSPYGEAGVAGHVRSRLRSASWEEEPAITVSNPGGALVHVDLSAQVGTARILHGCITAQSAFEVPLTPFADFAPREIDYVVEDAQRNTCSLGSWSPNPKPATAAAPAEQKLLAQSTAPYAGFDAEAAIPAEEGTPASLQVDHLYVGEVDQDAVVVTSQLNHPVSLGVSASALKASDGTAFAGGVQLFEVVTTGAFNGEDVADALLPFDNPVRLLPGRSIKIWAQVDARGASPGTYTGAVMVQTIPESEQSIEILLTVNVLPLELTKPYPLTLCTWDYVPNQWFPNRTAEVLDDMANHGVNVFPRSVAMPPATVDEDGTLTCDWSTMDAPLAELKGRGQVLFQMAHPPLTFAKEPSPEAKRDTEIAYLHQWRNHLRELGWSYADYALYPMDEPGLEHGKRVPPFLDAAYLFRAADPRFRIYTDPVPGLSLADYDRISPYVDLWCPNMRLVSGLLADDLRIQRILNSGKEVWSYECVAQVLSLSPLRYNRANAWRAFYFGRDGIGFWTHSTTQTNPWIRRKDFNEYELVYPGELPIPSVRWEAVRDGLEDVAAIALLQRAIKQNEEAGTKTDAVQQAKEALAIAQRDIMELSDQAFMESRDYLRLGDRRVWHTPSDVETYERHRARIAELTLALNAP